MRLLAIAARAVALALPSLVLLSAACHWLLYRASDPVARLRQVPGVGAADIQRLISDRGLDRPWPVSYLEWLGAFVTGDWGTSTTSGRPAAAEIWAVVPATLELALPAAVAGAVIGTWAGVRVAERRLGHRWLGAASVVAIAVPAFVLGLGLQAAMPVLRDHGWSTPLAALGLVACAVALRRPGHRLRAATLAGCGAAAIVVALVTWGRLGTGVVPFPTGQRHSPDGDGHIWSADHLHHLVLPWLTLTLLSAAVWGRLQRGIAREALQAPHVWAARARGLRPSRVRWGYAMRPASAGALSLGALECGALVGGAVVTEVVFSWPGAGSLLQRSVLNHDVDVAMALVMVGALTLTAASIAADVIQAAIDPRVMDRER